MFVVKKCVDFSISIRGFLKEDSPSELEVDERRVFPINSDSGDDSCFNSTIFGDDGVE